MLSYSPEGRLDFYGANRENVLTRSISESSEEAGQIMKDMKTKYLRESQVANFVKSSEEGASDPVALAESLLEFYGELEDSEAVESGKLDETVLLAGSLVVSKTKASTLVESWPGFKSIALPFVVKEGPLDENFFLGTARESIAPEAAIDYGKVIADLRRAAHNASPKEKKSLTQYADKLAEKHHPKEQVEERFGFEVRFHPYYTPDDITKDTFIVLSPGEYKFGKSKAIVKKPEFLHVDGYEAHSDMVEDFFGFKDHSDDDITVAHMAQEFAIVSGRVNGDKAYIWGPLTEENSKWIKEKFPKVKTVYQSYPFEPKG